MGINTVSGRISDCNMYHRGIYLQCEGRGAVSFPKTVMESMMSYN